MSCAVAGFSQDACVQDTDPANIPDFEEALEAAIGKRSRVQKVGEGTFKEVYRCSARLIGHVYAGITTAPVFRNRVYCCRVRPCTLASWLLRCIWQEPRNFGGVMHVLSVCRCQDRILATMPFDGDQIVNDEPQQPAEQVLCEVAMNQHLAGLSSPTPSCRASGGPLSCAPCFPVLHACMVVRGKYPRRLQEAWDKFKDNPDKVCENDDPAGLAEDQLFVIYITNNGGADLEAFRGLTFESAQSLLCQVWVFPAPHQLSHL